MNKKSFAACTLVFTVLTIGSAARAEVGMGLRAGTLGFGADLNIGLTQSLNVRLAYNHLNYDYTVEDTNVRYDGTLKIGAASALLDWHVLGGFRVSAGAVATGPKIDVIGTPTAGVYQIGGGLYTAAEVGDLRGQIKIGNAVAPYVGIGYGNPAGPKHRVTFLFDLGALYGGAPDVQLAARCGASVPAPICAQLQNDVQAEIQNMKDNVTAIKWYPIVNVGIGIRF